MKPITASPHPGRTLLILAVANIAGAAILREVDPASFRPFFGDVDPLLAVTLASIPGVGSLAWLQVRGWFDVHRAGAGWRAFTAPAVAATLLAALMILFDWRMVFPQNINVPPPQSLLFYPVMGWVVESLFHAAPLAILLLAAGPLVRRRPSILWVMIAFVAAIEPVFQTFATPATGFPPWARAYVAAHIFAIDLLQLIAFRRYGFLSMYGFRLIYYMYWHIGWGFLRLRLIF